MLQAGCMLQVMPSAWPLGHLGKQHAVATGSRLAEEGVVHCLLNKQVYGSHNHKMHR